jgi:hypothetical protein
MKTLANFCIIFSVLVLFSCKKEDINEQVTIKYGVMNDKCAYCTDLEEVRIIGNNVSFRRVDAKGKENIYTEFLSKSELTEIYDNIDIEDFERLQFLCVRGFSYIEVKKGEMSYSLSSFGDENPKTEKLIAHLKDKLARFSKNH